MFFRWLPLLLLLAAGTATPATYSLLNNGAKLVLNGDGTIDSHYPGGDKNPQVPTLAYTSGCLSGLTGRITGNAFSQNVRSCFTGTDAATATLAVTVTGTGSTAAWIISGNNLTHNGVAVGAGTLYVTATGSGVPLNGDTVSWSYVAPPSTDLKAPTQVTGLTQTGATSTTIDFAFDASSDPCGNTPCTGVASYNIKRNGVTVATQAASLGLQSSLTTTNLGAGTGTNTCTQTGANWSVVGAGTGVEGAADQFVECATSVAAGTYNSISATIANPSAAATYNKGFIFKRASCTATNDAAIYAGLLNSAGATYFQVVTRNGAGQSRGTIYSAVVTAPASAQIVRTSTGFVVNQSTDGTTWTQVVSVPNSTLSLPATTCDGIGATATQAGTSTTVAFTNVNVNNVPRVTKTVTGASTGTYTVTAVDGTPNESVALSGITGTIGSAPATGAMKYHDGTYVFSAKYAPITTPAILQLHLDFIQSICSNTNIRGVLVQTEWAGVEGPAKGNYTAGFAAVDALLAKVNGCNKYLMLGITSLHFGGWSPGNEESILPDYIVNGAGYGFTVLNTNGVQGFTARYWQTQTGTAFNDMIAAYGARYDGNARFEMVNTGETAVNVAAGTDGYSADALLTQTKRTMAAARVAFPTTQLRLPVNYLMPDPLMVSLIAYAKTQQFAVGGPDIRLDRVIQADRVFVGMDEYCSTTAFANQRLQADGSGMVWTTEIQDPELQIFTVAQLYPIIVSGYTSTATRCKNPSTQAYDGVFFPMPSVRQSYVIWTNQDYTGTAASQFTPSILPKINATGGATYWGAPGTAPCPTYFTGGCKRN